MALGRFRLAGIATLLLAVSCRDRTEPVIQLVMGSGSEQNLNLAPKTAFAEYVELPTQGDQLRVVLASYPLSCDEYRPMSDHDLMITLTFIMPEGQRPTPGTYPWPGLPPKVSSLADLDLKAPVVIPVVKHGSKSTTLLPGGSVDIQRLSLERQGEVAGVMRLEQSGEDGKPATRLFGSFAAKVCRTTNPTGSVGQ